MKSTVVGLYDDYKTAKDVYGELKDDGVDSDDLHMVSHDNTDLANWNVDADNWNQGRFGSEIVDRLTDLSVPNDDADLYAEGVRRGGTLLVAHVGSDGAQRVADTMNQHRPIDIHNRFANWQKRGFTGYERTAAPFTREQVRQEREHNAGEEHIPIVEENIDIGKRQVSRGGVRIHSHVEEQPVEKQVRLRDEDVDVERRKADRPVTNADQAFQDRTIEFRETDEEPVVNKEARVTGEVVVQKDVQERNETVRDTARRTEVEVEDLGGARTGDRFEEAAGDFRTHSDRIYGRDNWTTYEPVYRWGYMAGGNERYRNRDFTTAEPELRRDYEERYGSGTWDRAREAVHNAYDRAHH